MSRATPLLRDEERAHTYGRLGDWPALVLMSFESSAPWHQLADAYMQGRRDARHRRAS